MGSISKLTDLVRKEQAKVVKMNESQILLYRNRSGIVTGDLGSCHVVVLQSPIAVLLSHISPRADDKQPAHISGDQHIDSKMNEALELYAKWRSWFPQGSSAGGIYAWYDNKIALGDQRMIIQRKLASTGLPVLDSYYKVPRSDNSPGRGTVVCGWMKGDKICRLYVEDDLQNEITVHKAHGDLATTLASATRKKAEASEPSSSTVVSTSTASTQALRPQASGAQSTGRAVGAAAMTILGRFGIDAAHARVILQTRFREMQENPALSRDSDKLL